MNKVYLKTRHYKAYGNNPGFIDFKKSFLISKTSVPMINLINNTTTAQYTLQKGDEVILPFRTGGAVYGWFLGVGKSEKHVCAYWSPYRDQFYIVDIISTPLRCDWTKFILSPHVELAKEQIELYKADTTNTFTLDIPI